MTRDLSEDVNEWQRQRESLLGECNQIIRAELKKHDLGQNYEDLHVILKETAAKCLSLYKIEGGAKFTTFLITAISNRAKNYFRDTAKQDEKLPDQLDSHFLATYSTKVSVRSDSWAERAYQYLLDGGKLSDFSDASVKRIRKSAQAEFEIADEQLELFG